MNHTLRSFITEGTPEDITERYESLPQLAKETDFGEYDANIVVIDTETTGVSFKKDELTQIAAARLDHGEITDRFVTFVNPGRPIPEDITHLTGISDADVADAPSPEEALAELVKFAGDAKLVAHNAAFDLNFTTAHPAGYPLLENTWLDSLEMARISLPRMKSHRLLDLVKAFGAPLSTHRADEDVAATCALYRILLAAISQMPPELISQISSLTTPDIWPTSKVFMFFKDMNMRRAIEKAGMNETEYIAPTFSLRTIRRNRVNTEPGKPRFDAADMVSTELVNNSNMRVRSFGSSGTGLSEAEAFGPSRTAEGKTADPSTTTATPSNAGIDENTELPKELIFPTPEEVADAFTENGLVGTQYESYENRIEQIEMSQAVRDAFASSTNLVVEAGTGVGKSMAYLVPAAYTARKNNITVGIATKTNALLDQLVFKELPALSKAFEGGLTYTALKGFAHYPCLRKIQRIAMEGAQMRTVQNEEVTQAPAIAALLSFIEQTTYGDLDTLKIDYRALPKRSITTTSHDCLRRKCPFYGTNCFVHGVRRKAETSDIVVTNHSLLFCDVAADGVLLPPIRYWVIDEAHGAENEARSALSQKLSVDEINLLSMRVGENESSRNVFIRAENTVVAPSASSRKANLNAAQSGNAKQPVEDPGALFFALTSKAKEAGRFFAESTELFCTHVKDLLYFDTQKKSSYDMVDIWINSDVKSTTIFAALAGYAQDMIDRSEKLIDCCQNLVGFLEDFDNAAVVQREIAAVALELKDIVTAADTIFIHPSDAFVYSATLSRKSAKQTNRTGYGRDLNTHNSVEALPFNVGALLDETLYTNTRSIVFTSATLNINQSFGPFEQAMGLNTSEQSRANSLTLKSGYDFDTNMTVYVVNDLPEPSSEAYLDELKDLLIDIHKAQNGSMLTLFTNKKEMENCFHQVAPALKEENLRLVSQRWGVSVKGLRDEFLADETLSLFALKSFWEGFDAPGATLKGVAIPKLPFSKPSDPLSCERATRDNSAWRNYVLPQAVIEVKQAAGRLIRRADDKGILVLADSRLVTKSYGKVFLNSLPSKNIHFVSKAELPGLIASN